MKKTVAILVAMSIAATTQANDDTSTISIGAVLNAGYQDNERKFSDTGEDFSLGHSEITLGGNIDDTFRGALTAVLAEHDDETEVELEEAYIETIGLTSGLNIRAGRFLSNFGYLNNRHLHEDNFSARPGVYRAYLGGHYYDDGIGASYVFPTDTFLRLIVEALKGEKFAGEGVHDEDLDTVNTFVGQIKTGGDFNASNSWQMGLSYLSNRNGMSLASAYEHHEHEEEHGHDDGGHEHDHGHSHSAYVTGDKLYGLDVTWKWAPNGNSKQRNLAINAEYLLMQDLFDSQLSQVRGAPSDLKGWYLSSVYQFHPKWSAGIRYGEVETYHAHGLEIHDGKVEGNYDLDKLKETDVSISWHPSHFSKIRANYTRQTDFRHGHSHDDDIFVIEYIMSLGAHGAHSF